MGMPLLYRNVLRGDEAKDLNNIERNPLGEAGMGKRTLTPLLYKPEAQGQVKGG